MAVTESVLRGRESYARHNWGEAYELLSKADSEGPVEPDDLDRLGTAAYLTGRDKESVDIWTRAHHGYLDRGETEQASRCAFWLGITLMLRGERAPGGGWMARAHRVLDEQELDCAVRGYLLIPVALHSLEQDAAAAYDTFEQAATVADRFGDAELTALSRLGRGQALIALARTTEGTSLLDEAMVSVVAGEVSPIPAGIIYCAVILACQEAFDVRRAHEWTEALTHWCESQPDLVLYRGQCLVHRSEVMQIRGDWPQAMEEALGACRRLAEPPSQPAIGMAYYQLGELHRLRGDFKEAEDAYAQANQFGRSPHPGLAQLRLAQGRTDAAAAAIKRAMDETADGIVRAKMLPAFVDIMLNAGDVTAARAGADELSKIAAEVDAPLVQASSAHAEGAVLLAEGDASAACDSLRRAWRSWQELEAPYEAARVRVLLAVATRELGDEEGARMELDAARWAFHQLGAAPDLSRLEQLSGRPAPKAAGGLTAREVEVLRLVATGRTNRAIAEELVISEKTVARHVSNIFTKLGVPSRAAATAYAYEHDLV